MGSTSKFIAQVSYAQNLALVSCLPYLSTFTRNRERRTTPLGGEINLCGGLIPVDILHHIMNNWSQVADWYFKQHNKWIIVYFFYVVCKICFMGCADKMFALLCSHVDLERRRRTCMLMLAQCLTKGTVYKYVAKDAITITILWSVVSLRLLLG